MSAHMVSRFLRDESGATAVEYALLVTLLTVCVMATVALIGTTIGNLLGDVASIFGEHT